MADILVNVTVNGVTRQYEKGTTFERIAKDFADQYDAMIVIASVGGKIHELHKPVKRDCEISFMTTKDRVGYKAYKRCASFIMIKAVHDVLKGENLEKVKVEYSAGNGVYCSVTGDIAVDAELVGKFKARMQEIIDLDIPIWKTSYSLDEAQEIFKKNKMVDKQKLFKYRRASKVNLYNIEGFQDYFYGYMLPSTGYVKHFDLLPYDAGFVLVTPSAKEPEIVPEYVEQPKIFATMKETNEWAETLGVETVGALNDAICDGRIKDLIMIQEALHESKIAAIAQDIVNRGGVKFVMIAGPSSSGKTSFSHRLSIQLRAHGMIPHPIALDDYFVNRDVTPKDENGKYDYECLEAIDVEGFNRDMNRLLAGEEVEMPTYNFVLGKREYHGNTLKMGEDDILVIEGIHGLDERMSYSLSADSKYKVYISALTSMNIDEHNRIPTTDCRLLRRMVRDFRTRGASAKKTLAMWDSVRRGEEQYIFPFQESADAMFNSTLFYELAVLKQFAEPLLFTITKEDPEYQEAWRLLKFLDYFLGITSEGLPNNSIVKEFVGGSVFKV